MTGVRLRDRLYDRLHRVLDRWLFRVRPAEPAPIVLGRRRIFVLPTAAGLAYAAALLVMLIASINYSLSLGYALVFLVAGVAVASIFHAFRNLLGVSLRPLRAAPAFAGEAACFRLLVVNPRNARRPALRLAARSAAAHFDLAAADSAELDLACPTHRRGWLPLGRVVLETTYPLGLIRAWSVLVPDLTCLVYPAPEVDAPPLPAGMGNTFGLCAGSAGNDDFAGLRAHRRGDSPRHVAWKVVARGGPVLTKRFTGADGGEVVLDWDHLPAQMDTAARLARLAAWVVAAEAAGRTFSLNLPGEASAVDAGAAHAHTCLKRLALFGLPANENKAT